MSTTPTHLELPGIEESDLGRIPPSSNILRTPFFLPGSSSPLAAWLHTPEEFDAVDHGILLSPPIGYEHLHSYRSLRHLADVLAAKGFPVLRFDWHGIGDSPGTDTDDDRLSIWRRNFVDSFRWMREVLGCRTLSAVGLRIGGTIASLETAGDLKLENLVLWCPISRGKSFVRELHAIDLTGEARSPDSTTDAIEAGGFALTPSTAQALSNVNLGEVRPACRRILLVSDMESPGDRRLAEDWKRIGVEVTHVIHGGLSEMMAEPHRSKVPHRTLTSIADWIGQHELHRARPLNSIPSNLSRTLRTESYIERMLWFAEAPRLFGIMTEPLSSPAQELPTVLLLNAGATSRIGPGRLNVHLARRLAMAGYRSLRIDVQGLGDSFQPDLSRENDSYSPTAFRDIQLAIDYLRTGHNVSRCVLFGLCSGAYAAFQSAAQLNDPSVVESILVNPLTFFWREGMTIDDDPARHLIRRHYYLSAIRDPGKWFRFLGGRSKTSFTTAARIVAQNVEMLLLPKRQCSSKKLRTTTPTSYPSHPAQRDVVADLRRVSALNRHLTMYFSESDPGYMILRHFAGREVARSQRSGSLEIRFFSQADHTFSRSQARMRLIESLVSHFQRRYGESNTDPPART